MSRFAAVDCGTNSIRLLITEVVDGNFREIIRDNKIVRLGKGVDATGELDPEAIERTRIALAEYVDVMVEKGVEVVRMVATAATRDASNRDDFFSMTRTLLSRIRPGYQAEVITGEEEAQLSFRGAVADLDPAQGPFCVIDLGGGSTEFIVGTHDGEILGAHSAQMGCVRITERIMRSDPPTATEVEIARDYVAERIREVSAIVPVSRANTFVGVAGTFTTISAWVQGLESYDRAAIHLSELNFDALRVITDEIINESAAQRASNPVVDPGRADVIAGGSVVVQGAIELAAKEAGVNSMVISEKDILDGLILGLVEKEK
ncbi:Ppx/GppA phosphatase family protein [uncultured Corynebacterium sp.]|uniref:Ppx/GppA phosphatase family protein n=1 Tax=uncultured Corynebacterium sp. TaxID=159447 RepID=UPI0025EFC6C0|nr:Ppx/GppA phosphatase family protein [uncultured Corynebacterium sp.]